MNSSSVIDCVDFVLRKNEVITLILGGGKGTRLMPLTDRRSKPAVSFGGKYRLIDIPISNSLNSGFDQIFVLTQFNSYSLNRHISRTYALNSINNKAFVEIIAAEQTNLSVNWFEGTADAVRKVLPHIQEYRPKYVMILSGDQLYNMNLTEFMQNHIINPETEISVACNSVSEDRITGLGIVKTNSKGSIDEFIEKPTDIEQVTSCRMEDGNFLANMGIYIFNTKTLIDVLSDKSRTDFGKEILPQSLKTRKVKAYEYKGYWEDIGTIKAFYDANLMLTDEVPAFNLYDPETPLYTRARSLPPTKLNNARVQQALISEGAIINDADIYRSLIGIRQFVDKGTKISESVVMGMDKYEYKDDSTENIPKGIGKNCEIHKTIIDKDCTIGDGVKLLNKENLEEYEDDYVYIRDGIIIVPRRKVIPPGYEI
ncbi:MAG: glucose-1-phosphate adenylyltransferase [Leptospiraceae bacterium]|jgi:glucose-1-phosphate adenylyltransferase|nr:glucose-1-phosphate adenylyltransferase [Leptospiraceae bacterium]MCZ8346022.1 glucose-1-phosphate adenylyltransferase [Leptospiraceae bacterium]